MDPRRTVTSTSLLDGLKDRANNKAWGEIDSRYRPVIVGFARGLGLGEEEAIDVAQQTLAEFSRDYLAGKYARGKGRLGSWLMAIAHHRAIDALRTRARRRDWRGESAYIDKAEQEHLTQTWTSAQRLTIRDEAMRRLREGSKMEEKTVKAFELVAMRNMPVVEVAKECGMTADEVYVAKNRVTKRLREIVSEMTGAYEEDE